MNIMLPCCLRVWLFVNRICLPFDSTIVLSTIGNNISDETIMGDVGGGDSQPLNNKEKRVSWADVVSGNR